MIAGTGALWQHPARGLEIIGIAFVSKLAQPKKNGAHFGVNVFRKAHHFLDSIPLEVENGITISVLGFDTNFLD